MSSTFTVDKPLPFSATGMDSDSPYIYSRWGNPTVHQLEDKLCRLEGGEACQCFASGMGAVAAVFLSLLDAGDHLVVSEVSYPGVAEFARNTLPRFGINVTSVDTSDSAAVAAAMRDETRLVWIETPANPILRLTDIQEISGIVHQHNAIVAVDSTFATPVATRPLERGADLVMHSLTKYLGGHGDAMGGAVVGPTEIINRLTKEAAIHHGGVLSPFNAWLILRGIATLPLRMRGHEEGALEMATWLESHPAVRRVLYPGLKSHPQFDLASRQMDNFSGMISFTVNQEGRIRTRMMKHLTTIHYAVSLGHHRSLIYWLDTDELTVSSYGLTGDALERYRSIAGNGVFRFSCGLEDVGDLKRDLSEAID
ncbi:MAG: cystathionine gamma-synthase [marine bacterium B5-7]|nr:MAG: cystathionine gamma-synthase [marine bacterium B5-7]